MWRFTWKEQGRVMIQSDYLISLGCDPFRAKAIVHARYSLKRAKRSWEEHKQQFDQLEPPYIGRAREDRITERTKAELYARSDGRCAYCSKELDFTQSPAR